MALVQERVAEPAVMTSRQSAGSVHSQLQDRELIGLCLVCEEKAEKEAAWEEIVRRYRRLVFGVAYKFTGKYEEAEDLTQEIFLRVFRSLDRFDLNAGFGTWLSRM